MHCLERKKICSNVCKQMYLTQGKEKVGRLSLPLVRNCQCCGKDQTERGNRRVEEYIVIAHEIVKNSKFIYFEKFFFHIKFMFLLTICLNQKSTSTNFTRIQFLSSMCMFLDRSICFSKSYGFTVHQIVSKNSWQTSLSSGDSNK